MVCLLNLLAWISIQRERWSGISVHRDYAPYIHNDHPTIVNPTALLFSRKKSNSLTTCIWQSSFII